MALKGLFTINGVDLYSTFGLLVTSGADTLLKFPKRKTVQSFDWQDGNGMDYDVSLPVFEDVDVTLSGSIICNSEPEFWDKYKGLWTLLTQPGFFILFSSALNKNFKAFYQEMTSADRLTKLKDADLIGVNVQISIKVLAPIPTVDVPPYHSITGFPYVLPFKLS